jgi:hypothetical protein
VRRLLYLGSQRISGALHKVQVAHPLCNQLQSGWPVVYAFMPSTYSWPILDFASRNCNLESDVPPHVPAELQATRFKTFFSLSTFRASLYICVTPRRKKSEPKHCIFDGKGEDSHLRHCNEMNGGSWKQLASDNFFRKLNLPAKRDCRRPQTLCQGC